ncbi:ATP-binding protein [Belliella sp. R4-6]|uniref:ATP-binding protein n=1 Tax=Belliella alkalica TaxID=1730871 RepID=A0ABS9VBR5_9BACT|nr:ATP-binding protein [Belliella alkalica]MCH7413861.1 ATP-binding protein [Belliella alkalica]
MDVKYVNQFLKDVFNFRLENPKLKISSKFKKSGSQDLDDFISENKLSVEEVVFLLLTMIPYINPNFLITVFKESYSQNSDNPFMGGVKGKNHRGILPNAELLLFLLAGEDFQARMEYFKLLDENHLFFKKNIISNSNSSAEEPYTSDVIMMTKEYLELFILGKKYKPVLSSKFPAQLLETQLEWSDLVLSNTTSNQIKEIQIWLTYNNKLLNDNSFGKKIKQGYVALFFGPSGTGKTLTATLLGRHTGKDVYRIDLSQVISKYIGETEKNLSLLFDAAKERDWILFFDEADALFGKRTNVKDAHDKYANQEVSYLLQKIESHGGLVILASNYKGNIDTAFTRRFNSIIEFEMPKVPERLKIWQKSMPEQLPFENEEILEEVAKKYELNGANIINIVHYAGLQSLSQKEKEIKTNTLIRGIKREYKKEGKII